METDNITAYCAWCDEGLISRRVVKLEILILNYHNER